MPGGLLNLIAIGNQNVILNGCVSCDPLLKEFATFYYI